MLTGKVHDRISHYEEIADTKLLPKVPVIIRLDGRSFFKATSKLEKPFCASFMEAMSITLLKICKEVSGCIFGYTFHDEILIISKNDQTIDTNPWYNNSIQKIISVTSSLASLELNKNAKDLNISFVGDAVFTGTVFVVPPTEDINTLVSKQQQAFYTAVSMASFYELHKKYDTETVREILVGRSVDEKLELLEQECEIDFNSYPAPFRRGVACYKAPKLFSTTEGNVLKDKWIIDTNIPIFTKDHSFLGNIFHSGRDVFRANRDI